MAQQSLAKTRVVDPVLSEYSRGWQHPEHVGTVLFPRANVMASGGKILEFGRESFRLRNTARAPGSATKRMQFGYEGRPYALTGHSLEAPVPRERQREANAVPGIDLGRRAVRLVLESQSLELEAQQAGIATNAANYGVNNKVTLAGNDRWTQLATSNPSRDVNAAIEAVRASTGIRPNVVLLSAKAYAPCKQHPALIDRIKYTGKDSITAEMLAGLWDVKRVVVGDAVYLPDNANTFADVWGADVVVAYVPESAGQDRTIEEPSYGYTYTLEAHPFVEEAYWDNSTKSWIYGVTDERAAVLCGMEAGFLIKNAGDNS